MSATLKDQLEAKITATVLGGYTFPPGCDWWQLSAAEEEVFWIDRARFPCMMMTYHCYEAFKGTAHSPEWDDALMEVARQERPTSCDTPLSVEEFQQFGRMFGGLAPGEAFAMFYKAIFHKIRGGVIGLANKEGL